jgi:hypothetical protein
MLFVPNGADSNRPDQLFSFQNYPKGDALPLANETAATGAASAFAKSAVALNAAFLEEIKADNNSLREALTRLQEFVNDCRVDDAMPSSGLQIFEDVRDRLASHFALEEAYGYFDDAIESAPHMSAMAGRLRAAHPRLYEQSCRLATLAHECHAACPCYRHIARLRRRARAFLVCLEMHEQEENRLILESYARDIGAAD